MPSKVTVCNEGFIEAFEKCGAARVEIDMQKGVFRFNRNGSRY
jgi:hypothetical protein